jgi:hypothetical protein
MSKSKFIESIIDPDVKQMYQTAVDAEQFLDEEATLKNMSKSELTTLDRKKITIKIATIYIEGSVDPSVLDAEYAMKISKTSKDVEQMLYEKATSINDYVRLVKKTIIETSKQLEKAKVEANFYHDFIINL